MPRITSSLLAALLAGLVPPAFAASCEWRAPAHDPFRGDVPAAVDDYPDIPAATRARLKSRMARFAYDDIVTIKRDSIEGNYRYEAALLGMHFGRGRICAEVTRQSWPADHEERSMAYCEDGHCIVVPLVCRNVSRIIRRPTVAVMGGPTAGPTHPLSFEAPGAGLPAGPVAPDAPPTAHILQAPPSTLDRAPPPTDLPLAPAPPLPPLADAPPPAAPPLPGLPTPGPDIPPVVVTPPTVAEPPLPPQEPAPPPFPPLPGMPPLPPAIPEPATWALWGLGLATWLLRTSRRRTAVGDSG